MHPPAVRPALRRVFPRAPSSVFFSCVLLACAALPGAPLQARNVPDAAASSSSAMRYLQSTLHVRPEVAACVAALSRAIHENPRYDRLVQLDRYVIRAQVRHDDAIFSIEKPLGIDTLVVLKGSARVRQQWTWQPVITRCGLKAGQVVATSLAPRVVPAGSATPPHLRPGTDKDKDRDAVDGIAENPTGVAT